MANQETALIVGVGSKLSASLARLCHKQGMSIALAARNVDKLSALASETNAEVYKCDASEPMDVENLFSSVNLDLGEPDLIVFNASARVRGGVHEIDPNEVQKAVNITCFAGFLVGHHAAKQMRARGSGTILFTGASASVKGYPDSSCFFLFVEFSYSTLDLYDLILL